MDMQKKTAEPKRPRGRPRRTVSSAENGVHEELSREIVLATVMTMTQTTPLDSISFVQIARQLGVTPGSVSYYVGARDDVISATINALYERAMKKIQALPASMTWRERLRAMMRAFHEELRRRPGIASYLAVNGKFRIFQKVSGGETDWGRAYLDYALGLLQSAGFSARYAALAIHLMHAHVLSSSYGALEKVMPHHSTSALKTRLKREQRKKTPGEGLLFGLEAFADVDIDEGFEEGIDALIRQFARRLKTDR